MPEQRPRVGTKLINDAGTCVKIVNLSEGEDLQPGTIPANRLDEWLAAGYRPVTADDVIPVQAHQVNATDTAAVEE